MNDDDLLRRATSALRETSSEPNPRSGLTRARILNSAEKQARARRSPWLRASLAFASVFMVGTALARFGEYLPVVRDVIAAVRPQRPPVQEARPAHKRVAMPPPVPVAAPVVPEPVPVPESESEPVLVPERVNVPVRVHVHALVPVPVLASPAPTPAPESAELALFRRAQALHLARSSQALAAWDDYLRVAEHGVLVPEAKYNRALCLVRLGRSADARAALEPFARGDYHAYRQHEAAQLLEALAK